MKKQLLILLLLLWSAIANATTYYISSSGSDSNNGTSTATPFLSISKVNSLTLVGGDQVLFKRGDTFYGTLNITRSGSIGSYITFGAYGTGDNPIVSGFTSVTSWTNLGSNIWESTNAVSTLSTCNMVAVNGVNTAMGRWPNGTQNDGYLNVDSKTSTSITSSGLSGSSVTDWTGAQVLTRAGMYLLQKATVTGQSGTTLNFSAVSASTNYGFFIQNDARTLDTQNEWFFNTTTKKLRIYSTSQPTDVKVASIETLVFAYGNYLKIENISFEGSNGNMAYNNDHSPRWHHISFNSCSFKNSGSQFIYTLTHYLSADNCTFKYSNSGGIFFTYGNGCSVTNSSIENVLQYPGMSANGYTGAVQIAVAKRLLVQYCNFKNIGYAAVSFYGDSTEVKNNFIDTYCNVLDDGGAIYTYTGNRATTWGNKINYNIIVNGVGASGGMDHSSSIRGIYLDLNSSNVEIGYNSIYKSVYSGIFHNSRRGINVHHNTILDGGRFSFYATTSGTATDSIVTNNRFNYNILVCRHVTDQTNDYSEERCLEYAYYAYPSNTLSQSLLLNSIAEQDYNAYWRMTFDNKVIRYNGDNTASYTATLATWQGVSSKDAHSFYPTKAISDSTQVKMYYNATKVAKTINIWQPGYDYNHASYSTPITLQPYTSIVLVKDNSLGYYYYLSTSGSDSADGLSASTPWKTLAKANATNFADGTRIYMKAGDVWNGETLNLTNATQGWDDEILVTSYGTGNKPTISGFETLTSWTSDGNGIYHATVSNAACNMVTVNGVNTPIARYPKTGYLTFESFSGSSSITDNELSASPSWSGAKAVIRINGFQYAIASVTGHSSHTLSITGSSTPDATGEYKYFLQGHVNALTAVGDWYLSGTTLYMYFGANNPSSYTVKAAKVAKLVTTDKNYVTLDGIRIEGAIEKGYESTGTHNTVQNCDFEFMGRYGITCSQTTPTIDNNTLSNGNGTAIFMNANSYVLKNNTITNNGIYAGMVEPSTNNYFGINIIAGSGGTCEYNTISNVGYIGISTWGSDNIIRYNKVDGFCSILPDGGGVYANYIGSAPYPTGIKIYNNLVFNGGGEGLYSDAVNQNTEWYNNTVINCVSGILLNTPVNHNVHDNTFYNCTYGMNFYNWHTNSLTPTGCTVTNNTIVEGSNSTFAVKIGDSTNRDILSMGTVNNNKFYSETSKQAAQFKAYFTPAAPLTNYNIADWRTLTGFETTSTRSTIANFNKLSVIYNDTKANKDFTVVSKKDLSGVYINGIVTLTPFMSKVLVDGSIRSVIMNKKLYAF